jgi:Tol biopolymer transport system component
LIGRSLPPYEILEKIGAGGMGEVYRARDTSLGRDVALKVLPDAWSRDAGRIARFEREARSLAALHHPNIATLFGFHDVEGMRFLAMELVEGRDLAERLVAGPLPVDEALDVAAQIAEGLEEAHERGIVHRDLKPANVKVTSDGRAKILDFGLAQALADPLPTDTPDETPTAELALTEVGAVVGTAAYMSPEQARGKPVDRRTDIWAFGCLLYECLTGQRAFEGETVTDRLAAVLQSEPDWSRLPAGVPPTVRELLQRCLRKDPRERQRDIGDARVLLAEARGKIAGPVVAVGAAAGGSGGAGAVSTAAGAGTAPARRGPPTLVVAVLVGMALGALGWKAFTGSPSPAPPEAVALRRIPLPTVRLNADFSNPAVISPDGRFILYPDDGRLWMRDLTRADATVIPESEDAQNPFWSPDSRSFAFGRDERLWKYDVASDTRSVITSIPETARIVGGAWAADGTIYLAVWRGGLYRTHAGGGQPEAAVPPDSLRVDFHSPSLLPDGHTLLLFVHAQEGGQDGIAILRAGEREPEMILPVDASNVVYSPTGHLLYTVELREEAIWAIPFDAAALKVTGDPFLAVHGGQTPTVSNDGTMVYFTSAFELNLQMLRVPRDGGAPVPLGDPVAGWGSPSFSPDGRFLAYSARDDSWTVWQQDLQRGARTRLWRDPEPQAIAAAAWLPDGRILLNRMLSVYRATIEVLDPVSGQIVESLGEGLYATASPDGEYLVYGVDTRGDMDLYARDLQGVGEPFPVVQLPGREEAARVSPDGRWVAYHASQSGDWQVFLRRFPSGDDPLRVSLDGGRFPFWHPGGDTLFYSREDGLMEVAMEWGDAPRAGEPRRVLDTEALDVVLVDSWWDPSPAAISPDGKYFVVGRRSGEKGRQRMVWVENWAQEFQGVGR